MRGLILFLLLGMSVGGRADETRKLVVGIKQAPPFSMLAEDGSWEGISVELWHRIANQLGYEYEWRPIESLDILLNETARGEVDLALGALTVTSAREEQLDFSHSFHNAGLAIGIPASSLRHSSPWRAIISWRFIRAVGALLLVLLAVGICVWFLERRRNVEQFGGSGPLGGIGEGFWWSAVTMTTVGYGDRAPQTSLGRAVAVVWMFASVIIIATFTGAIASALTVDQLSAGLDGPGDLPGHRVAAVASSTAAEYLQQENIAMEVAGSGDELIPLLLSGKADAIVHDAPLLQYLARSSTAGSIIVLPEQFERQDYGLALPPGSALREPVNRSLLEVVRSSDWSEVLRRYLGR